MLRVVRFPALRWLPLSHIVILMAYVLLAAWYTHPLLARSGSHIAGKPSIDPLLNASVLWWNATTVPLTDAWWNPPHFYPSHGVTAFTENLLGVSLIATPIYWLTGNPLTTYNVSLFLTWPLSAFAAYWLTLTLTRRRDAAFIAGLAYGFSPYRAGELGHIQMASCYWMGIALVGLHRYLIDRRAVWLLLFGSAWLLQSLANGYMMLYGAVLIGLWVLYFCSKATANRPALPAAVAIGATWVIASLPLIPIMLTYRRIHMHYGLERSLAELIGLSYPIKVWFAVSDIVRLWGRILPDDGDNMFPGIIVVGLVIAAAIARLVRKRPELPRVTGRRAALLAGLGLATVASVSVIVFTMFVGGWQVAIGGLTVRVHDLYRAVLVAAVCGTALVALTSRVREAFGRRSLLLFYTTSMILMAICALGPVVSAHGQVLFEPAPYGLLLALPGFDAVRITSRFWMLGLLCLATAAGLAFSMLAPRAGLRRRLLSVAVAFGVLAEGWISGFTMVPVTPHLRVVEPAGLPQPVVELPIGDGTADAMATFRSMGHRRRVVNGVSGYDPPHYAPLVEGLMQKDPEMIQALASLASFDAVVDESTDGDGAWTRFLSSVPGAARVAAEGTRSAYRIPAARLEETRLGEVLPIVRADANAGVPTRAIDGTFAVRWDDGPQHPKQWFTADLGVVRDVAGVTEWLGKYARDFPRHLAIDVSVDARNWETVWEGRTAPMAFLAAVRAPREAVLRFAFPARPARFVRLRQLAQSPNIWVIEELHIHGPR